MPHIKMNSLNMFYEEFGRGEALLFLHSHFSRGLLAFSGQILPFAGHYHCFYPDFRGHGRTMCESLNWNSRIIADDMANFLDAMGIKRAHLLGYSCGAYVGCYMAAKYPDKVKSLVTIGGGAYPRVEGAEDFLPESLIDKNNMDFIEDMKVRHYDAHQGDWQTYLRTTVADWKSHPNLSEKEWASIKCPAFFINGEYDPFGTCTELQAKVPHAKIYEVKDGGHRPHFVGQQAEQLNAMILDFLAGVDRLAQILTKFVESEWDLIAVPSKAWLDGNGNIKELLAAIEQADKECGTCGCELDPLYKRALGLLKTE